MLGLVLAILACFVAAGLVAVVVRGLAGALIGTFAGMGVIVLTFALKTVRWPDAPLTGDGPAWLLLVFYGIPSAVGAGLGAIAASRLPTAPRAPVAGRSVPPR